MLEIADGAILTDGELEVAAPQAQHYGAIRCRSPHDRPVEQTSRVPDHRYFKVRGADGNTYILRHDAAAERWELTLFWRADQGD